MTAKRRIRGIGIGIWLWLAVWATGHPLNYARAAEAVFDGLIEPFLVVEVGSEVPGVLDSVKVDRGDMVKAGQVVATLRSQNARWDFKAPEAPKHAGCSRGEE